MISEDDKRKEENTKTSRSWPQNRPYVEREGDVLKLWGIFLFGFIGAAVTTFAVGQLRRTSEWFYTEFSRSSKGTTGGSFHSGFKEEAWRQYKRRLRDHYEEEMERVERIRRMQRAFNRERNRYKRSYERWSQYGPEAYHQNFQGDDWYWTTERSYNEQRANSSAYPHGSGNYSLSHHYSVLGLDRWRTKPYTDQEIKSAFREKAMQYHPDQNLDNKEAAEAKFKEVLMSYETIKSERKNERL